MESITKQEHHAIPVKIGDEFKIHVSGKAKNDYYYTHEGFIIFIKKMPDGVEEELLHIKITGVKESFGFADYLGTVTGGDTVKKPKKKKE